MAVPEKHSWRRVLTEKKRRGLSASQFGAALGFSGRVSDFVAYQRDIVGTYQEFTGNEATAHGIRTEPLAKVAYELLMQEWCDEGGFFIDRAEPSPGLLGASPDGICRWFPDDDEGGDAPGDPNAVSRSMVAEPETQQADAGTPPPPLAPAVTQAAGGAAMGRGRGPGRHRRPQRLLEIKSPFRMLYSGSTDNNKPFGIPLQYMCQMQGQMHISGATECDFFTFLRLPSQQVAGWRVKRSDAFWRYARPKYIAVCDWVDADEATHAKNTALFLQRSFQFEPFDYASIEVEPLIWPTDISTGELLRSERLFPFFMAWERQFGAVAPAPGVLSPLLDAIAKMRVDEGDIVAVRARGESCATVTDGEGPTESMGSAATGGGGGGGRLEVFEVTRLVTCSDGMLRQRPSVYPRDPLQEMEAVGAWPGNGGGPRRPPPHSAS